MTWPLDDGAESAAEGTSPEPGRRRERERPRHAILGHVARGRAIRLTALVALAFFLFVGTWVGMRGLMAKAQMEHAQALVGDLKEQVSAGEYEAAVDGYHVVREHTSVARNLTSDPLWRLAEHVPVAGRNLGAFREITEIVDDAMIAAGPLAELAGDLDPSALVVEDGGLPMEPIIAASREVPAAAEAFTALVRRLDGVSTGGTVPQIGAAKATLGDALDGAASALNDARPLVEVLPALLGADGPRSYVVMFQNNAELRSLGGTALSFAEVSVDNGKIGLARQVPAGFDNFPERAPDNPILPVPEGFEDIYPLALGRFIANATLRPSAETAAQLVQAQWQETFGTPVDGVVSMDSGALSALLTSTEPIELSTGDVVDADNVASLLLNTVYQRYNSGNVVADDLSQNAVYEETLNQTFARISSGQFEPVTLIQKMRGAAEAGRFSVWLVDEDERAAFESSGMAAGGLPESTETEDVIGVFLNDQVGAKLNYYLGSRITSGSGQCTPDGRQVHRVTLALSTGITPDLVGELSPSITGTRYARFGLDKGEQKLLVLFYLPPGSTLLSTVHDGVPVPPSGHHDEDHPVQKVWVSVPPGGTTEVTVDVLMGTPGSRTLVTEYTPTVNGTRLESVDLACETVAIP